MMRNDQNTIGHGGQSARGIVSRPASGALRSCLRISDESLGISTASSDLGLGLLVGKAEQDQRRAVRVALEMAFHRHDLGGLVLQRVEAVRVAGEDLDRRDHRDHAHRHGEHHARALVAARSRSRCQAPTPPTTSAVVR